MCSQCCVASTKKRALERTRLWNSHRRCPWPKTDGNLERVDSDFQWTCLQQMEQQYCEVNKTVRGGKVTEDLEWVYVRTRPSISSFHRLISQGNFDILACFEPLLGTLEANDPQQLTFLRSEAAQQSQACPSRCALHSFALIILM
jgi:hypothetical protein